MKSLRAILLTVLAGAAVLAFGRPWGGAPPLAPFLSPFTGFWCNGRGDDAIPADRVLPGLREDVTVLWDERHIPHIFARNRHDLFYAQGYFVARDRLWQMDLQSRAAAGRLAEVLGPRALAYDRYERRIGMLAGAERSTARFMEDAATAAAIRAYCAGVNAWIRGLDAKHLPVEFKALAYRPERFTPLHVALLLKYFQWDLTWKNNDLAMTRSAAAFDTTTIDSLYPLIPPFVKPVIPPGTRWNFAPLPVAPAGAAAGAPQGARGDPGTTGDDPSGRAPNGSNDWALAGTRTLSGRPLLCNDVHLDLTLPSIWYEIQLTAPGLDVYGITAAGCPGVIFGQNRACAWGGTNAESDVIDWYRTELRPAREGGMEYRYGDGWRPAVMRIDTIAVRGVGAVLDTTWWTHHGPVVYRKGEKPFDPTVPVGCAMRWTALDTTDDELGALLGMDAADGYDSFARAVAGFGCPGLNIAYADTAGTIAIWHQGRFPLRPRGSGRTILDGSDPAQDWQGFIPAAQVPQVKNPPRGFVSSANEPPTDATYPYYLGWDYDSTDRITRIDERLERARTVTPGDMMDVQLDILNVHARAVLPVMLPLVRVDSLSAEAKRALDLVSKWDFEHRANSVAARIFTVWWRELYHGIWDDDIKRPGGKHLNWPSRDVTREIILDNPTSRFIDDRTTPRVETLEDITHRAFVRAVAQLHKERGALGPAWTVGAARGTRIPHLARIPGFGIPHLPTGGAASTVNATTRSHGPTWRFVCSLGPRVRAWTVYPGGESGNPGSAYYDSMVDDWMHGKYHEVLHPTTPETVLPGFVGRTHLEAAR